MKKVISISEADYILGITTKTLRRWYQSGKLLPKFRTIGGHRRYELEDILKIIKPKIDINKKTLCYSRVSSYEQKEDLIRQSEKLKEFCKEKNFKNIEVIEDLGSGLNFKKKGLKKLTEFILNSRSSNYKIDYII